MSFQQNCRSHPWQELESESICFCCVFCVQFDACVSSVDIVAIVSSFALWVRWLFLFCQVNHDSWWTTIANVDTICGFVFQIETLESFHWAICDVVSNVVVVTCHKMMTHTEPQHDINCFWASWHDACMRLKGKEDAGHDIDACAVCLVQSQMVHEIDSFLSLGLKMWKMHMARVAVGVQMQQKKIALEKHATSVQRNWNGSGTLR